MTAAAPGSDRALSTRPTGWVVVGQTPPPYHGQAIAIQAFLDGHYPELQLHHVRMGFSTDIKDVGSLRIGKAVELIRVAWAVLRTRLRYRVPNLYFPPGGGTRSALIRDLILLPLIRPWFKHTVFHFHAAGIDDYYDRLPAPLRPWFHIAYGRCDLAIKPSAGTPVDAERLRARRVVVIPNGIPDLEAGVPGKPDPPGSHNPSPRILYLGALTRTKGVLDLLEACLLLRDRGCSFQVDLVGEYWEEDLRSDLEGFLSEHRLEDRVTYHGPRYGADKDRMFEHADIFCFPSYYPAETAGLVAMEAMRSGRPVVATQWRGLPEIVEDGVTGYLVPIRDIKALADRLDALLADPTLRRAMGSAGRARYERNFTVEAYRDRMARALRAAAG